MLQKTVMQKLADQIQQSTASVFLRSEFNSLGSYRQVSRALKEATEIGLLFKVGFGLYAKARPNTIGAGFVPIEPLIRIAKEALNKLGVETKMGKAALALSEGRSTQVPMLTVINVGKSRVSRKIVIGSRVVVYEKD